MSRLDKPSSLQSHDSAARAERHPSEAASRLFALTSPVPGTIAETYLRGRGITGDLAYPALRFLANCYYRADDSIEPKPLPALIARVTDLNGRITGVHRTWLRADGGGKADLPEPRKALGELHGHGVRFGIPSVVLAAGEGIETMLSLRSVLPTFPCCGLVRRASCRPPPPRPQAVSTSLAITTRAGLMRGLGSRAGRCREADRLRAARAGAGKISTIDLKSARRCACSECSGSGAQFVPRRPLPFPVPRSRAARAPVRDRESSFASSPWLPASGEEGAPLGLLRVARKPEPRAEGNGGCPFIFRRGPHRVRFASRSKINAARRPPLRSGRGLKARGAAPARASGKSLAIQGRKGRPPQPSSTGDPHDPLKARSPSPARPPPPPA